MLKDSHPSQQYAGPQMKSLEVTWPKAKARFKPTREMDRHFYQTILL